MKLFGERGTYPLLVALFCFTATPIFARFHQTDADEVDREDLFNTQTVNDVWSYEAPVDYQRLWLGHDVGIQAGGGSYNARRFHYSEDLKFSTGIHDGWSLHFRHDQTQTLSTEERDRELRAQYRWPWLHVAFLTDGDSYKGNADFGAALGWRRTDGYGFEVRYFSVDRLYRQKRWETDDQMLKQSDTWEWSSLNPLPYGRLRLYYERDSPLLWTRSKGEFSYDYGYQRQRWQILWENHPLTERGHDYWSAEVRQTRKQEYKYLWPEGERPIDVNGSEGALASNELRYGSVESRLRWVRPRPTSDWVVELIHVSRDAEYLTSTETEALSNIGEKDSDNVRRRELGVMTYLAPYRRSGVQLGLFANRVFLREGADSESAVEIKLSTAWSAMLSEKIFGLITASWDVDGLAETYPYDSEAFKPWDGGALRVVAVF